MPELGEVEYYRKQWNDGIGQQVIRVHLHASARDFKDTDTRELQETLTGATLMSSTTHGKQMAFFSDRGVLGIHLGMTGKLLTADPDHVPEKHDHLVLYQDDLALVFRDPRKFGRIRFSAGAAAPEWWEKLPPQVLSDEFTPDRLSTFLDRHSRPVIKALLLNQEMFPGVGNWMADETLWRARIHPATRGGELSEPAREVLWEKVREVCQDAMEVVGTDWGEPPESWLFNHRWKDGGNCPRCGADLHRETIGGRTTCWCPPCQG